MDGWIAVFGDGPCTEQQHEFMVEPIHKDLYMMPSQRSGWKAQDGRGYLIVGYGEEPEEPWEDQVHYVLRQTVGMPADGQRVVTKATYALAELDRWKWLVPWIEWDKPVEVSLIDGSARGFACRVCIASDTLHGGDIPRLPTDAEVVRQHIREAHGH
jgi:hypothetical protein